MMQNNLIDTILRAGLEETGAQRGLLVLSSRGENRIVGEAVRRKATITVSVRNQVATESLLPKFVLDYLRYNRKSVVIDDDVVLARSTPDSYLRRYGVGSTLCLPLLHGGEVAGVLRLESDVASGVFTPARIKILEMVASLAASALENSRLARDFQEREGKIRRLVDANIIGIYIVDLRGPILESNDAFLRMLGYKRRDFVSGHFRWTDLTPPEWRATDKNRVARVKRAGRLAPFEKEFFRKDGTRVPVLLGVARFDEPRTQAIVFALDMSRQKQAEASALESRMIEQTGIARKKHDALLQDLQGLIFRFQAVRNLIVRHPEEALQSLNEAIEDAETALDHRRNAIRN
jgi:PAS domain S-box-containing protein